MFSSTNVPILVLRCVFCIHHASNLSQGIKEKEKNIANRNNWALNQFSREKHCPSTGMLGARKSKENGQYESIAPARSLSSKRNLAPEARACSSIVLITRKPKIMKIPRVPPVINMGQTCFKHWCELFFYLQFKGRELGFTWGLSLRSSLTARVLIGDWRQPIKNELMLLHRPIKYLIG